MVSRNQIALSVRNKKGLYETCLRNDFDMPSLSSGIVSIQFMFDIMEEKFWCPKLSDTAGAKSCPKPPTVKVVTEEIRKGVTNVCYSGKVSEARMEAMINTLDLLEKKGANKAW